MYLIYVTIVYGCLVGDPDTCEVSPQTIRHSDGGYFYSLQHCEGNIPRIEADHLEHMSKTHREVLVSAECIQVRET